MNKAQEKQWQRVYDLVAEIDHTFSQIDTSRISENQLSEFGVAGRILQSIGKECEFLYRYWEKPNDK
tara:strand:+ start:149 stop:349 length:201 start_codon:yes stop_codon:yes gene_type:complete